MLEVPALAWQLPAMLPLVDFISIGSNDLMQFLFAADRGHPKIAARYDPLSTALLAFLHWVVQQCRSARKPVTLCGEMVSRPMEAKIGRASGRVRRCQSVSLLVFAV